MRTLTSALLISLTLASCGDDTVGPDAADASIDDMAVPDAPEGFVPLAMGSWELAPSSEGYFCIYARVTEDTYITGFDALAPLGTHHSLLTVLPATDVIDTTVRCRATTLADRVIFGAGVGTETLELGEGVAVKLEEGQQILLNLHLFNASDQVLRGTSGVFGRPIPQSEVIAEADATLVGPTGFSVPARASDYRVTGSCTLPQRQTIVAVAPHMHWFGTYLTLTAIRDGEREVLFEDVYDFDNQAYRAIEPMVLEAGDTLEVECRYDNPSDVLVPFGDSTREEMCYGAVFAYPPLGASITCSD